MVGPKRPVIVLFGSSIVQYSFRNGGWGATLADLYSRQADVVVRGYAGWNSRQALQVLTTVFPKDSLVQPSLVIVYFGGNDSCKRHPYGLSPHVPLSEYKENMRRIGLYIRGLSETTRVIFLSCPPVSEKMLVESTRDDGIHFSAVASDILAAEILKAICEAKWDPSLYLDNLQTEFEDVMYPIQPLTQ
ncbi:GDSL esterase/lipase At2g38180-like isoform X2 [Carex rostrata]